MRKKTKKNTGVAERHCLSIIPLCISGKCVLTDFKMDTDQSDGMTTDQSDGSIPTNRDKTTDQSDTLLERNRRENIKATSSPLPALRQAKTLTENQQRERIRKQIKILRNAS